MVGGLAVDANGDAVVARRGRDRDRLELIERQRFVDQAFRAGEAVAFDVEKIRAAGGVGFVWAEVDVEAGLIIVLARFAAGEERAEFTFVRSCRCDDERCEVAQFEFSAGAVEISAFAVEADGGVIVRCDVFGPSGLRGLGEIMGTAGTVEEDIERIVGDQFFLMSGPGGFLARGVQPGNQAVFHRQALIGPWLNCAGRR